MNRKYDFDDIMIVPAEVSDIYSRSECNVLDANGMLPIMTAPMDTVINIDNYDFFRNNDIYSVFPRIAKISAYNYSNTIGLFNSYSLSQFNELFMDSDYLLDLMKDDAHCRKFYALIDIANGHMDALHSVVTDAKTKYGSRLWLMVGNVANPETYRRLSDAGADGIRIGIGGGSACLTSVQTGIGYPMASLISECYEISKDLDRPAKIIADGGLKSYSDMIKALSLGADFCMVGSIFNKALESCGDTYKQNKKSEGWTEPGEQVDQYSVETQNAFEYGTQFFKKFRGMSTKGAQKSLGAAVIKTSEGITRMNQVEYTIGGWVENFKHYLSSAMSYTNSHNLTEFKNSEKIFITEKAFNRFSK